jgi:hypothetical protein
METDIFDSSLEKKFEDLSSAEKLEMKDLFTTKEEFMSLVLALKSFGEIQKDEKPSEKIKADLDHLYNQTYRNKGILWYNSLSLFFVNKDKNWYQQNLTKIAAVFLLGLLLYPIMNSSVLRDDSTLTAENKQEEKSKSEPQVKKELEKSIKIKKTPTDNTIAKVKSNFTKKELSKIMSSDSELDKGNEVLPKSAAFANVFASDIDVFSEHPDGVFNGSLAVSKVKGKSNQTIALSSNLDFLDLLTPTY